MWRHNVVSLQCDASHLPLEDASVDLVVCSPPYYLQRSYTQDGKPLAGQIGQEGSPREYVDVLLACTREWMRVLKPTGSMFVNIGDKYGRGTRTTVHGSHSKEGYADGGQSGACPPTGFSKSLMGIPYRYALGCMDDLGLIWREEIIWSKVNPIPESARDRCSRTHEQVFHFTKQGHYYSAVDRIREEPAVKNRKGKTWQERKDAGEPGRYGDTGTGTSGAMVGGLSGHPAGKSPSSVWEIASQPLNVPKYLVEESLDGSSFDFDHFAAFPEALPQKIILGWSPKDVCAKCGEGRFPVTDSNFVLQQDVSPGKNIDHGDIDVSNGWGSVPRGSTRRQIVGSACACTPYADHQEFPPSVPGVVLDPFGGTGTSAITAAKMGRHGITCDLSYDYAKRLVEWRMYDLSQNRRKL